MTTSETMSREISNFPSHNPYSRSPTASTTKGHTPIVLNNNHGKSLEKYGSVEVLHLMSYTQIIKFKYVSLPLCKLSGSRSENGMKTSLFTHLVLNGCFLVKDKEGHRGGIDRAINQSVRQHTAPLQNKHE